MHLPRHTIESHAAVPLFQSASFCSPDPISAYAGLESGRLSQPAVFSCASLNGFLVAHTDPLKLVANRSWSSSQGGLSHAVPVQHTSLLFLVGGGRVPRFAPNKVILWDEAAEYAARSPVSTSRDTDFDDDDLGSVVSRHASTIFSAGSEFDAYGRARSGEHTDTSRQKQPRSSSPSDSLRFSTSSLIHADDLREENGYASSINGVIGPHSANVILDRMEYSVGASSLGIGRLQASQFSDGSDGAGQASALLDDDHSASSSHSHSILASSANLADPFAEEEPRPVESSPPSMSRNYATPASQSSCSSMVESSASYSDPSSSPAQPVSSHQRIFQSQASRRMEAGLVDSVSSMATASTDATTKPPAKILRGREVAELEFSEVVRGIYATSVHIGSSKQKQNSTRGKGRASMDSNSTRAAGSFHICVVLVVLLSSKAVVFELSSPSAALNPDGLPAGSAWRIQKRAAVQTYKNLKGLGSVAPYDANLEMGLSLQPSVIVAIPGRQKGHVQLLRIKLQSFAMANAGSPLSIATSSVGAASIIVAHESSIASITLSPNGRFLATASSKGTLIRIWSNNLSGVSGSNTDGGRNSSQASRSSTPGRTGIGARLIRELRRGTDAATILSIAFAPDASLVAAASDKGTIHIFLLNDPASTTPLDTREDGTRPPSSSSRAANLRRAAAQYLPAGIGNLAGQIPPSVIPQYLKSEWSSAQFRIPLKSFGASSRHYSAASTDEGGMYGAGAASGAAAGTEKSTEGAWAQMRSRISDIRKGEASVDEQIFLCWIVEAAPSSDPPSPVTTRGSRPDVRRPGGDMASKQPSTSVVDAADEMHVDRHRSRLIAVTTSGGWYKLAVTMPGTAGDGEASGSTVLDMYRRDSLSQSKGSGLDKANVLECRLVEFRPMVGLLDGWRA